jgi:mRNA (guanine-N7-)-methyltransferase
MDTRREDGEFFRLQNFHNAVKFKLLESVVNYYNERGIEKLSLLDVSVGKGGDYHKWKELNIDSVTGIDPSKNSIDEANKRKNSRDSYSKNVQYLYTDPKTTAITAKWTDNVRPLMKQRLFDIVSCQMSLHYFFQSEDMLNNAIKNISDSLLPGGIFVGTSYNGSSVFSNRNEFKNYNDYVDFKLLPKSEKGITPAYTMIWKSKKGTKLYMEKKLEQDSKLNIDKEFFSDNSILFKTCKKYNLFPISLNEDFLKLEPKNANFKQFKDWYKYIVEDKKDVSLYKKPKDMKLRNHEQFISFLHNSFVFIKKINLLETSN